MSARMTVTGNIGKDPRYGQTGTGKSYLGFSVAATPRRKNRDTDEWEDVGEPLWLDVTLWEWAADLWRDHLTSGTKVAVEGVLQLRAWKDNDGQKRINMEIGNARMLGATPKRGQQYSGRFNQAPQGGSAQDSWSQPPAQQQAQANDFGQAPF